VTRLFLLLALDPATGAATRPVGVVGVDGETVVASFLPYVAGADLWRGRLAEATATPAATIAYWLDAADGVASAIGELDADGAADGVAASPGELHGLVELAVDRLLVAPAADHASVPWSED
jgi:hypothetical protein